MKISLFYNKFPKTTIKNIIKYCDIEMFKKLYNIIDYDHNTKRSHKSICNSVLYSLKYGNLESFKYLLFKDPTLNIDSDYIQLAISYKQIFMACYISCVIYDSKYIKIIQQSNSLECSICLNTEQGDFIELNNCKHKFHKKCINMYIKSRITYCPNCRTQM